MAKPRVLRTLRQLSEAWHAFERASGRHVRALGLTPAQFDILATLGDTPGMTCGELGERTLITKGTLTGVLDRLEARGLVVRTTDPADRRQVRVALSTAGTAEYERTFEPHVQHLARAAASLSDSDLDRLEAGLERLRDAMRSVERGG